MSNIKPNIAKIQRAAKALLENHSLMICSGSGMTADSKLYNPKELNPEINLT